MKKVRILAALAAALSLLSATSALSARMSRYVDRVEKHCAEWTAKEWEESMVQYKKLHDEYKQSYDSLTQKERDDINRSIGRYGGLYIKFTLGRASEKIQKVGERIPPLVEGFMSAFESK